MYIGSGEDVENQQEYIITLCLNKDLCGNRKGKKYTWVFQYIERQFTLLGVSGLCLPLLSKLTTCHVL